MTIRFVILFFKRTFVKLFQAKCTYKVFGMEFPEHSWKILFFLVFSKKLHKISYLPVIQRPVMGFAHPAQSDPRFA